jgi:hypothetical protein
MSRYIANPVEVEAQAIKTVRGSQQEGFVCLLEDGTEFKPDTGMTARMTPVPGDYVVIQKDGYTYLNPKEVFERKYSKS